MKDIKISYKYLYVLRYGKLMRGSKKEWIFIASPFKDCPVHELSSKSKWTLVETLFDVIKDYK